MNISDSRDGLRRRIDLLLALVVHLNNFAKGHRGLTGGLSLKEKDSNDSVARHHVVGLVRMTTPVRRRRVHNGWRS